MVPFLTRQIMLLLAFAAILCIVPLAASAQIYDEDALRLVKQLSDPKPSVRATAAEALGEYAQNDDVAAALIKALGDTAPAVRKFAAESLGRSDNQNAVPPLLKLLADPNPNIRVKVVESLGNLQDARAVEALIKVLQGDTDELKATAADALWRIGDPRAVEPLLVGVTDKDWQVREASARGLGIIGDDRAIDSLLDLLKRETEYPVLHAATAVGQFDQPRVTEALLALAQTPQQQARVFAIQALGGQTDARVLPALLKLLQDAETADSAIEALAQIGDPRAMEALLPLLKKPETRDTVLWNIERFRDERTVDALIPLAKAYVPESQAQLFALKALGVTRDVRAIPTLLAVLKARSADGEDPRFYALEALETMSDLSTAVDALLTLVQDKDEQIRYHAIRVLGRARSPKATDALIACLKLESPHRDEAIYALALTPDRRAVKACIDALKQDIFISGSGWEEEDLSAALMSNPSITIDDLLAVMQLEHGFRYWNEAMVALSRIDDPRGLAAIIEYMASNAMTIRDDPVEGNICIEDQVLAALRAFGPAAIDELLALLRKNDDEVNKTKAIEALGMLGEPRAIELLLAMAKGGAMMEQGVLFKALARLKVKEALPLIVKSAQSQDDFGRIDAIRALGILGDARAVDVLIAALNEKGGDDVLYIRASAALALGGINDQHAADALAALLADPNQSISDAAALSLGRLNDPRAIEPLLVMLGDQRASNRKMQASQALATVQDPRVGPTMVRAAARMDYYTLSPAILNSLAARREPAALKLGISKVREMRNPEVQIAAVRVLQALNDRRGIPALLYAANDPNDRVRAAAVAALKAVTGQDFGDNHAAWVGWWVQQPM